MAQSKGYLLVDHRASPGLPEDMALRLGLDPATVRGGAILEADTLTCCHCKTVQIKNWWRTRERASCPKCSHRYLCDICATVARRPDYDHTPWDKLVDVVLEADARKQPLGSPMKLLRGG